MDLAGRVHQALEGAAWGCLLERDGGPGRGRQKPAQDCAGALFESGERVAAFEYKKKATLTEFVGQLAKKERHGEVSHLTDFHSGQRVVSVSVKTTGDQDHLGFEIPGHGHNDPLQKPDVLGVAAAGRHGEVYGGPSARPLPRFAKSAGSGIVGVLVGGDVEDAGVAFEGVLGAVAVMDIPVQDHQLFQAHLALKSASRHGHVVEETKTHGAVAFGVVARRPHGGKSGSEATLRDLESQVNRAPGRQSRDIETFLAAEGIGIELKVRLPRAGGHGAQMMKFVHPQQFFLFCQAGLKPGQMGLVGGERLGDGPQAFGSFRMPGGLAVVLKPDIFDDPDSVGRLSHGIQAITGSTTWSWAGNRAALAKSMAEGEFDPLEVERLRSPQEIPALLNRLLQAGRA